jgi:hypothetical protein
VEVERWRSNVDCVVLCCAVLCCAVVPSLIVACSRAQLATVIGCVSPCLAGGASAPLPRPVRIGKLQSLDLKLEISTPNKRIPLLHSSQVSPPFLTTGLRNGYGTKYMRCWVRIHLAFHLQVLKPRHNAGSTIDPGCDCFDYVHSNPSYVTESICQALATEGSIFCTRS